MMLFLVLFDLFPPWSLSLMLQLTYYVKDEHCRQALDAMHVIVTASSLSDVATA